jgi:hypothetical protein
VQAILEFLQQHPVFNAVASAPDPAEPNLIAALDAHSRDAIQYELNRLVLKQVNRLYHLKENFVVESIEDLIPVQDMDGEYVNPLDLIPAPDIKPDEALLEKESTVLTNDTARQFELALSNRPLVSLLRLGLEGIIKPAEIAERLKIPARVIYNLRERLQRAWQRFSSENQT